MKTKNIALNNKNRLTHKDFNYNLTYVFKYETLIVVQSTLKL
jgi:hypothetical protein